MAQTGSGNIAFFIDTAHPVARIAIVENGKILAEKEWENTPHVGTHLLVYLEELLLQINKKKTDISEVLVHPGPGNSGLVRTGIVTGTVLANALGATYTQNANLYELLK